MRIGWLVESLVLELLIGRCKMGFGDSLKTIMKRLAKRGKKIKVRTRGLKFGKNGKVWRKEW